MHPDPIEKIAAIFVSSDSLVKRQNIVDILMKATSPLFLSPLNLPD